MGVMSEFGNVLMSWRQRVSPAEVGLPAGGVRRTRGLRREELAALAGMSVDYVVRLEQGRARHPSPQLLGALSRALRLSEQERDHLYLMAGAAPPPRTDVPRHIPPGVQRMTDRLGDVPVAVYSAAWDILQWNPLWAALLGDPSSYRGDDANLVWRHFMHGHAAIEFSPAHEEEFASDLAADLRSAHARYATDAALTALVARLRSVSPAFAAHWDSGRIAQHRSSRKTVTGSAAGPITVDCDVLTVPGNDLRMVVYTAVPGSEDASRLALLRVAALQASPG